MPDRPVCPEHHAPLDFLEAWCYDRPPISLVLGPRGGGKSFLSALGTHIDSIAHPRHGTRILGGSLQQSEQIYNAIGSFHAIDGAGGLFKSFTKTSARYATDSDVRILAASPTSVRGPHIPTLRLDEVDEIASDIREASYGMAMDRHGVSAMIPMTSTWHNIDGPMGQLVERAHAGEFPLYTFCAFEVLAPCPSSVSGPRVDTPDLYAGCPECPLQPWCHADVRPHPDTGQIEPKAKRGAGHYGVPSLIQKVRLASRRVFEADYLCSGPKADGIWFPAFDPNIHVSEWAEFHPDLPTYLAVDTGVYTGAVWFQMTKHNPPTLRVFADYLSEGRDAEQNARAILDVCGSRCQGLRWIRESYTDPAGEARNPVGPTVLDCYHQAGLPLFPWPREKVADGLELIESYLNPADGNPRLFIHPRCVHLIRAFQSYRRAKRQEQWSDKPEDPQHPAEDLMDSLRGGIGAVHAKAPAVIESIYDDDDFTRRRAGRDDRRRIRGR